MRLETIFSDANLGWGCCNDAERYMRGSKNFCCSERGIIEIKDDTSPAYVECCIGAQYGNTHTVMLQIVLCNTNTCCRIFYEIL